MSVREFVSYNEVPESAGAGSVKSPSMGKGKQCVPTVLTFYNLLIHYNTHLCSSVGQTLRVATLFPLSSLLPGKKASVQKLHMSEAQIFATAHTW
jgi:hypothetical protein